MPEDLRGRLGNRSNTVAYSPTTRYSHSHWEASPQEMMQRATDPVSIFIGNLSPNVTEDMLRELFGRYGRIMDVDIHRRSSANGRPAFSMFLFLSDVKKQLGPTPSPLSSTIPSMKPSTPWIIAMYLAAVLCEWSPRNRLHPWPAASRLCPEEALPHAFRPTRRLWSCCSSTASQLVSQMRTHRSRLTQHLRCTRRTMPMPFQGYMVLLLLMHQIIWWRTRDLPGCTPIATTLLLLNPSTISSHRDLDNTMCLPLHRPRPPITFHALIWPSVRQTINGHQSTRPSRRWQKNIPLESISLLGHLAKSHVWLPLRSAPLRRSDIGHLTLDRDLHEPLDCFKGSPRLPLVQDLISAVLIMAARNKTLLYDRAGQRYMSPRLLTWFEVLFIFFNIFQRNRRYLGLPSQCMLQKIIACT